MEKKYTDLLSNHDELFAFLKSKFKLYHLSNVFFRDLHYGVWEFLKHRGVSLKYGESEDITHEVVVSLEKKNILRKLDEQTWLLNYPRFKLTSVQKNTVKGTDCRIVWQIENKVKLWQPKPTL
ncbi:MAG: hypothetical protein ABSA44_05680 [Bacteroidota bacterium]